MEFHPRINVNNTLVNEERIILGSFPVWSLTNSIPEDDKINELKRLTREKNNEIEFYYGSKGNLFWVWYKEYFDSDVILNNPVSISNSLKRNSIGITDLIIKCERKDKSAYDKDLTNRTYNHSFFKRPSIGEKIKILCTSKGVMNEMLLNGLFFERNSSLRVDKISSNLFQYKMCEKLRVNNSLITKPVFRSIECENGGIIECFALPSPGSPYRKLEAFGFESGSRSEFLGSYLSFVFNWFKA